MSRLKDLRKYVNKELLKMTDEDKRTGAIVHLYGVSLAATMIAKKRGLDPELASMAAMLHDLHAYKSGSYDDHAHKLLQRRRQKQSVQRFIITMTNMPWMPRWMRC